MPVSNNESKRIVETLKSVLRKKFENYDPETKHMPFHTNLLGKDRMALFSFIHSLNTNFGTTIFQPVAEELAKNKFQDIKTQHSVGNKISSEAREKIQQIIDDLTTVTKDTDKLSEIEELRKVAQKGEIIKVKLTKADIYLKSYKNEYYYFDIKTAKPNKGNFVEFKRTMLEWVAAHLFEENDAIINTCIAIP